MDNQWRIGDLMKYQSWDQTQYGIIWCQGTISNGSVRFCVYWYTDDSYTTENQQTENGAVTKIG